MNWDRLERREIKGLARPLLVIKGEKGVLACAYINADSCDLTGEACALVTGVTNHYEMLEKSVFKVNKRAMEIGVVEGMTGRQALEIFRGGDVNDNKYHDVFVSGLSNNHNNNAIDNAAQAIVSDGVVYVSGIIGGGDDIKEQTKQTLINMKKLLAAAKIEGDQFQHVTLADVVKVNIYIKNDLSAFVDVNGVYATFFTDNPPARATFAVSDLPHGALIQMDCIAAPQPIVSNNNNNNDNTKEDQEVGKEIKKQKL